MEYQNFPIKNLEFHKNLEENDLLIQDKIKILEHYHNYLENHILIMLLNEIIFQNNQFLLFHL